MQQGSHDGWQMVGRIYKIMQYQASHQVSVNHDLVNVNLSQASHQVIVNHDLLNVNLGRGYLTINNCFVWSGLL